MDRRPILWMELDEWKSAARAGKAPDPAYGLQKSIVGEFKAVEGVERGIEFVVSRNTVDRDNDTIKQDGWDLSNFLKNPVVPFAHDYKSLPVARAVQTNIIGDALVSTAQFATREMYPFADTVYQMVKEGFLNATSVGFRPKSHEVNKDRGGIDFLQQELLEYSVVPIPSNPQALVQARSLGIDMKPLKEWAEQVLEEDKQTSLWLPKKQLEEVSKVLSPITIVVGGPLNTTEGLLSVSGTMSKKISPDTKKEEDGATPEQPSTPKEVKTESATEEHVEVSEEVKASEPVQKINPIVLQNPLPNSQEWMRMELEKQIPNFLTRNGKEFREEMDMPLMVATYEGRALFCVIGRDRPFEEDPCFQASFTRSEEAGGMPQWSGEPSSVDIEVEFEIVQQSRGLEHVAELTSWKQEGHNGQEVEATPALSQEVKTAEIVKEPGQLLFEPEALKASLGRVVPTLVRDEVQSVVRRTIRELQGKVD